MGFFDPIDVAASGLTAERVRMDVTAENLANAQTTRGANGQPYQRQEVVLQQAGAFGATLAGAMGPTGPGTATGSTGGVEVSGIVADPTPDKLVYDPGNPDANAQGYVRMPNVNTVTEMVDLISEQRAYEANVTAKQTDKTMLSKTFDLLS